MEETKMKMSPLFLICMLIVLPSQAANEQAKMSVQQSVQTTEIEKYISGRRKAIENYYTDRLTELRLRAHADIRLLEIAEQPKPDCTVLNEWADFVDEILQINGIDNGYHKLDRASTASPAERLATGLSRIAKRKNDILSEMQWQTVSLERQKNYALTEGFEKFRNRISENLLNTKPQTTNGVITGIIYSANDPISIIDGTIVRQNENIHGVKIVKIHEDRVEFEKNGRTWTQKIREIQKDNWQ
jgi:hypothetical protein